MSIRSDIGAALGSLDSKGRTNITGAVAPRQVKKALPRLPELLGDEPVHALTMALDPLPPGASFGEVARLKSTSRLLVLTDSYLWEVKASGRLNGSQPQGIQIPLEDIQDVRTLTDRKARKLGTKERFLTVDVMRGYQLETRVHELPSDTSLEVFGSRLVELIDALRNQTTGAENASECARPMSVADELAKLVNLRDTGVLSQDEFAAQKARLLEG